MPTKIATEASQDLWSTYFGTDAEASSEARGRLLVHYQNLVEGIARKIGGGLPTWIDPDDLISYGQIGLIKALEKFDPARGAFKSFASTYIHGAIMDELRSQDWAPRGLRRDQRQIQQAFHQVAAESLPVPRNGDREWHIPRAEVRKVAAALGWPESRLVTTARRVVNATHLHLDDMSHADVVDADARPVDSDVTASMMCLRLREVFDGLGAHAQLVMARRYYLGESLAAVAASLGLDGARVREIHDEAVSTVLGIMREFVESARTV